MTKTLFHYDLTDAQPGVYRMRTMAMEDGGIVAFPYGPDWENAMTSSIGFSDIELSQADLDHLKAGGRIYR